MAKSASALAIILLCLTGCSSSDSDVVRKNNNYAISTGSPYRLSYKANVFGGGGAFTEFMINLQIGHSNASEAQKSEITAAIEKYELTMGRGATPITDVRPLPDGREVWTLDLGNGYMSTYVVTLHRTQYSSGDFDIGMPKVVPKNV
jgi:hypothetical protein